MFDLVGDGGRERRGEAFADPSYVVRYAGIFDVYRYFRIALIGQGVGEPQTRRQEHKAEEGQQVAPMDLAYPRTEAIRPNM